MRSAGWYPPGGGSAPTPRVTTGVSAGVSVAGRSPFAVHCVDVERPASIPACATDQRTYIEQSQVDPVGSRVCISATEPPRSVGGPRLYVKRPTWATAQPRTAAASPVAPVPNAPPYSRTCARTASTYDSDGLYAKIARR